jgi:hypothetical protein
VWSADTAKGDVLTSEKDVILATPTVYDFSLYQTSKSGKEIVYSFDLPVGLYSVRLKFAEMWLDKAGQRPMDIEVNGRLFFKDFDPFAAACGACKSIDVRAEDITPDANGKITVCVKGKGANPAILQGIEIQ